MTNKLKIALMVASIFSASSSFAAGASQLTGIKGTLKNVEKAIKSAVKKSEELYEQNGGANLGSDMNLLTSSANNPFVAKLGIKTSYRIVFTFNGTSGATFVDSGAYGANATVPVTKGLLGTQINLVPIFNTADNVISSWECLTNADKQMRAFMGSDVTTSLNHTSFISTNGNNGDNEYLSNCIYVEDARLETI